MGSNPASPFRIAGNGVRVAVKLAPKSARDRVQGLARDADGSVLLKTTVAAAAVDGKANAALIALLAKTWSLPKTSITLVQGAANRRKTLHLAAEPKALLARLERWLDETVDLKERHG
jgi:uncharacterized protein